MLLCKIRVYNKFRGLLYYKKPGNVNMDVSFEVIRGTGSLGKSKLEAYFLVRMQKKDTHTPLELKKAHPLF